MASRGARRTAGLLTVLAVVAGCSKSVPGTPRALSARDSTARTVPPADLDKLLLADEQVSGIIGAAGMVTKRPYTGITPSQGEMYSDPACSPAIWNTMFPVYDGSGYTGAAGRWVEEPEHHAHHVDQAVVSFPSADAATRFVIRVTLAWQHCADVHLSTVDPPPAHKRVWYTIGYPHVSEDISTVVSYREGGEGLTEVRAIASRSNVVIDVDTEGIAMSGEQAAALVKAITDKMPH